MDESRGFVIDIDKVEIDGRLTVMVRNIPIKYTQEMLMELFSRDEKIQKFDFFYLPIDSNVIIPITIEQLQFRICIPKLPAPEIHSEFLF